MSVLTREKKKMTLRKRSSHRAAYAMTLMTSNVSATVLISSRCAATEIIPVAMTKAKYPGNKLAAACRRLLRCGWFSSDIYLEATVQSVVLGCFRRKSPPRHRGHDDCSTKSN